MQVIPMQYERKPTVRDQKVNFIAESQNKLKGTADVFGQVHSVFPMGAISEVWQPHGETENESSQ